MSPEMQIVKIFVDGAWSFLNLSYTFNGVEVKLYYPFLFFAIVSLIFALVKFSPRAVSLVKSDKKLDRPYVKHNTYINNVTQTISPYSNSLYGGSSYSEWKADH